VDGPEAAVAARSTPANLDEAVVHAEVMPDVVPPSSAIFD